MQTNLGGRIPLLDPAALTGEQRAIYDRLKHTMVKWADASGFQSTEGDRLIGPFNPVLLSPGITPAFLDLQDAEQANTSLDGRVRQVVILAVGAVWRSPYELYAHAAVAAKAGLSETAIRALVSGAVPEDLRPEEQLAARFARALSTGHRIEAALYHEAEAAFGPRGLVDLVYLAGCYHIVCGLLNIFDIPAPAAPDRAASGSTKQATLTTIALFPVRSFLENLAVRRDNSVLVTSMNARELFYVAPSSGDAPVAPMLLHRFDQPTTGLVEIEPDLFLVSTSNLYTTHESFLHLLDLRGFQPGSPVRPEMVFRFPDTARGLNGSCLLAPGVVLIADCFAGLIWRLDVQPGGRTMQAGIWLKHETMGYFPGKQKPEQPGVNGVRYAARTHHLYYTATARKLLMRVPVDPATLEPAGSPELVVAGRMGDDFCIDEDASVIYLATHRQNSIDRISMDPGDNSGFPQSVVGDPFTEALVGPCSLAWGRAAGEYGRVAFVISDGGTASPSPGGPLPARLQRVEF
ncbi:carboxymuconolactone decarboxylase family protein [Lichenicoccus sp.]|uniref:carboxymuconolactone decarboxylase family protein n=1 Tax=Lichenicoccus sp. TaxID=2781899 RepID=UPI003D0E8D43